MSDFPRIDTLSHPPVRGRTYMVPTVRAEYFSVMADWPVTGHQHEDKEFFNFEHQHYHVDIRFLKHEHLRAIGPLFWRHPGKGKSPTQQRLIRAQMSPLHGPSSKPYTGARDPLPSPPVWMPLRCIRPLLPWAFTDQPSVKKMQAHYAGQVCARGKVGFICPHRQAQLGSVAPVDGIITCPLHGLRIDAESGTVLPSPLAGEVGSGEAAPGEGFAP